MIMFKAILTDGSVHKFRARDIFAAMKTANEKFGVERVISVERYW